jgi:hypothetical protein
VIQHRGRELSRRESLLLMCELGVLAAKDLEGRRPHDQQSTRGKYAGEFRQGAVFVAGREMDNDIQADRRIKNAGREWKSREISLG